MNRQELIEALKGAGMFQYFDDLEPALRNTIRLNTEVIDEQQIRSGASKIGGQPDLPGDFMWPTEKNGKFLSFIAQINFTELVNTGFDTILPTKGILYFFYAADQDGWGFEYAHIDKFRLLYFDGDLREVMRTPYPETLAEYARYKPTLIKARSEISLPDSFQFYEAVANEDGDKLYDIVHGYDDIHKMFGYADVIQNEMELECELVTNGLYCGDPSGYNDPRAKELEPNAKEWILLLQIDSTEENEMMWGDAGRLYFWIKKSDLADLRFHKAWMISQCS